MRRGHATGLQVAFLAYAVMLLAVPISNFVVASGRLEGALRTLVATGAHFLLAAALMAAIPPLRHTVASMLRPTIPASMRAEVVAAWILKQAAALGGIALLALWYVANDGPGWIGKMTRDVDRQLANAYTASGIVILCLSSTIGPVIEEIVFRGFIYRAFERQWGWIASLLATSTLFGMYHAHFWIAFVGSVVMICVLRRTGSLRAPILVHMLYNFFLWPPLLGQHVFPRAEALSDPASWILHGTCLAFSIIAVPAYVYMSRDRSIAPTIFLDSHAALQK